MPEFLPASSTRNPFSLFALLLLAITGVGQIASSTEPGSLSDLLPTWVVVVWSVTLVAGPALILVGVFLRRRLNGLLLEVIGCAVLGPPTFAYATAIATATQLQGSGRIVGILLGLAIGAGVRIWEIVRYLRRTSRHMQNVAEERS